jgi:hypothetical protein
MRWQSQAKPTAVTWPREGLRLTMPMQNFAAEQAAGTELHLGKQYGLFSSFPQNRTGHVSITDTCTNFSLTGASGKARIESRGKGAKLRILAVKSRVEGRAGSQPASP